MVDAAHGIFIWRFALVICCAKQKFISTKYQVLSTKKSNKTAFMGVQPKPQNTFTSPPRERWQALEQIGIGP